LIDSALSRAHVSSRAKSSHCSASLPRENDNYKLVSSPFYAISSLYLYFSKLTWQENSRASIVSLREAGSTASFDDISSAGGRSRSIAKCGEVEVPAILRD